MRRVAIASFVLSAACGLTVTGSAISPTDDAGAPTTSRDAASSSSGDLPDAPDGRGPADASKSEPTCKAIPFPATSTAMRVDKPIVVDGITDEWPCEWRAHFDGNTAGGRNVVTSTSNADYALAWDDSGFYFMVRAYLAGPPSGGVNVDGIYNNDAAEIYLAGDPVDGAFTEHDLHLIVDWRNTAATFRNEGATFADVAGIVTKTTTFESGFVVEGFIPKTAIGLATMKTGPIAFEVQIDEHRIPSDPNGRASYWLYATPGPNDAGCGMGRPREPACDSYAWGTLALQ